MSRNISITNTTVILNSTQIAGWSEDADALTIPEIEIAKAKVGADGRMIGTSTGDNGGEVQIKLLANSNSVKFLSSIVNQQRKGSSVTLSGSLMNHDTGYSVNFSNGIITTDPTAPSLGKGETQNMVYIMFFENIDANFESANFS